jgi:hypothetical protein
VDCDFEVETKYAFIDILSSDEVTEIKHIGNCKHAIDQAMVYSTCYPNHEQRIILFHNATDNIDSTKKLCESLNIGCDFLKLNEMN